MLLYKIIMTFAPPYTPQRKRPFENLKSLREKEKISIFSFPSHDFYPKKDKFEVLSIFVICKCFQLHKAKILSHDKVLSSLLHGTKELLLDINQVVKTLSTTRLHDRQEDNFHFFLTI